MRKLFLAFLVLSAAAALGFAQDAEGTVTWSGEAKIGAKADFTKEDPTIQSAEDRYAQVKFSYDKGALNTEVYARGSYDEKGNITGYADILGEYGDGVNGDTESNFKAVADVRFLNGPSEGKFTVSPDSNTIYEDYDDDNDTSTPGISVVPLDSSWNGTSSLNLFTIEKLYGYFWLLDRQLKLDVAYKGYETRYWRVSDLAGSDWANLDGNIGLSLNFIPSTVNGLSAGIAYSDRSSATIANLRTGGNPKFEDVLASAVIGAKYEVSPISASFMLQFDHDRDTKRKNGTADQTSEGAFRGHLAFKYTISGVLYAQTDWQLAMTGKYKNWDNDSNKNYAYLVGGAKVNYESRPLTAGLTVKLNDGGDFNTLTQLQKDGGIWFDSDKAKLHHSYFVLNPYVYYDLIKDTLQVRLPINVGLDIAPETDSHKSGSGSGFTVEPGLYWNAKRDGAKEDPSRGIRLKYKLGFAFDGDYAEAHDDRGDFINQLTLMFYWDF